MRQSSNLPHVFIMALRAFWNPWIIHPSKIKKGHAEPAAAALSCVRSLAARSSVLHFSLDGPACMKKQHGHAAHQ